MKRPSSPKIPVRPKDVPEQRSPAAVELPDRPAGFQGNCLYFDRMPDPYKPNGSPRNVLYLGSVEWADSPMNTRVDSYYLNPRGRYWLLWNRYRDENTARWPWRWELYACGPRRDVESKKAAVYLLMDAWTAERRHSGLSRYFLIDEPGFLSVEEISAIADSVWGSEEAS